MRKRFGSVSQLKQRAKSSHLSGELLLKRWFVNKYKLPPSHELFTGQSEAELMQEFYEDLWVRRDEIHAQIDGADDLKYRSALYEQLNGINRALGEPEEHYDEFFEQLERDFNEGRTPDFAALKEQTHGRPA
jgi:hypothetical protein